MRSSRKLGCSLPEGLEGRVEILHSGAIISTLDPSMHFDCCTRLSDAEPDTGRDSGTATQLFDGQSTREAIALPGNQSRAAGNHAAQVRQAGWAPPEWESGKVPEKAQHPAVTEDSEPATTQKQDDVGLRVQGATIELGAKGAYLRRLPPIMLHGVSPYHSDCSSIIHLPSAPARGRAIATPRLPDRRWPRPVRRRKHQWDGTRLAQGWHVAQQLPQLARSAPIVNPSVAFSAARWQT